LDRHKVRIITKFCGRVFDLCNHDFEELIVFFCCRQHDYENFLCTLLLPSQSQISAFVTRAFNTEVAKVQDQVTEPQLGQMKMKFWEETSDKIYVTDPPSQPVAVELQNKTCN